MSKPSTGRRTQRRALAFISAGALAAGVLSAVPAATAAGNQSQSDLKPIQGASSGSFKAGRYIVLLDAPSATRYAGGNSAFAATRVAPGERFNGRSAEVKSYSKHLEATQNRKASAIGATVASHYTIASNGFAAKLTGKQAFNLSTDKSVLMVTKDVARHADTWNTPNFLGLAGTNGAWAQNNGQRNAGDGVVIGDIDSGIWPESRSFSGAKLTSKPSTKWGISRKGQATRMQKADGGVFNGACELGAQWSVNDCNTKLIGARYYPDTFLDAVPPSHRSPTEVISTRDGGGHGTHTASTAGGNMGVDVTTEGVHFGEVSGMAPAAKIAAYKVCFDDDDPDTGGCYNSAILAAVDDAITDGVDVINFSISGATDTVVDAVEYAFEGAAEAGIFVSASAGNSGPGASTVAHNSPWLTTVAASTHHNFENTVVLGNGTKIKGASISRTALPQTKLVTSTTAARAGADADAVSLCGPGTLDPAKATGAIVVCNRGVYDRVAKSAEVKAAGGVGMILANITPGSLDADFHAVPTIHISDTDSPTVSSYIASFGANATAAFELGDVTGGTQTPLPQIAPFSSRGPAIANDSDLLKPDITAPGVSVLAAVAPPSNSGRDYDLYSGTSMSAPHITGLAAFMMGVHPSWTPMQVKSAMMTTASSLKQADGSKLNDPFAQGAGQVRPKQFFNPGWFVTSDAKQWRGFLQGQGLDLGVEPLAAKDLNGPSMAQGQVTSSTSFTREFTSTMKGTWNVAVNVPGFTATTAQKLVSKRAGDRQSLRVTFTRTTAPLGQFSTGYLTLTGPTRVRIPIALRPVSVKAPTTVTGAGADGSVAVPITAGFTGDLPITVTGLAKAQSDSNTVTQGQSVAYCVDVTQGTKLARFDLDSADNTADMDLYVYAADAGCNPTAFAGQSATGAADESVSLANPAAGKYYVQADGYSAPPGQTTMDYRFDFFDVDGSATLGNLAAVPNPVPVVDGVDASYDATWSGLEAGNHYLGYFEYQGALAPTYIYVTS